MASLWEVVGAQIGFPPLWRPLPHRRSPVWEQFCNAVESFVDSLGILHRRSPSWVYRQLHSRIAPSRLTWRDLLGETQSLSAAAVSLLLADRPDPSSTTVLSWNIRWIVDPHSDSSTAKRNLLSRLLAKGYVVCVQETHWSAADAAIWQHGLLLRNLYWTPATDMSVPTDEGSAMPTQAPGKCGGVATFLPAGHTFASGGCETLVPGFAISTTILNPRNEILRIINVYMRPGNQEDIWRQMSATLPANANLDPSLLIVGDFNTDLAVDVPRPGSLLLEMCNTWGVLRPQKPTWRGKDGSREIDGGLVPVPALPDWDVSTGWTQLSDHAILTFRRGRRAETRELTCSPARFWALPKEAGVELRRNWESLLEHYLPPHRPTPFHIWRLPDRSNPGKLHMTTRSATTRQGHNKTPPATAQENARLRNLTWSSPHC